MMEPFIDTDKQSAFDLGNGDWEINIYRSKIDRPLYTMPIRGASGK
jgi:hypothetical protein